MGGPPLDGWTDAEVSVEPFPNTGAAKVKVAYDLLFGCAFTSSQSSGALAERLHGSNIPVESGLWEQRFRRFETFLWCLPGNVKRWIRNPILGGLQQARCASVTKYAKQVTNDEFSMLNEDLQLDVRLLKLRENQRLLRLRQRLDDAAMGASADAILSQKWSCACDQANVGTSFKAFRAGAVTDDDLSSAQDFFESYLRSETDDVVQRQVTITQIASCKAQRYRMFGTVAADASLSDYEEYDKVYMKQQMAKSILKGAGDLVARAELVARWSFTNHYDFAIGHCMEAMGVGQLRNNYHRHIHQDMKFTPSQATLPSRKNAALMTEVITWTQKKKARNASEASGA